MPKFNFCNKIAVISLKIFCELKNFLGTKIPRSTIICTSDIQSTVSSHYCSESWSLDVFSLMRIVKINSRFWIKRSALEDLLPLLQDVRLHGGFKARVLQEYFKGTLGMSKGSIEYLKCVCEVGLRVNISRAFGFYF